MGIADLGTTWGMHIAADTDQVAADRVPINRSQMENEKFDRVPINGSQMENENFDRVPISRSQIETGETDRVPINGYNSDNETTVKGASISPSHSTPVFGIGMRPSVSSIHLQTATTTNSSQGWATYI